MKLLRNSNLLVIILIVLIASGPLFFMGQSEFGGADGEAEEAVLEMNPGYEPWAKPFWEPPSGEIESLLFSLQVAMGSGVMGYVLGILKERKKLASHG
ncbi:energy-coupling factor ABC transporter substrate-binding protein [Gudongella sp. SC589]|jgi:cobalt/nickel transport protein|uniref:energy-coupling factor ABC transporter substrate-binding protein n=1 Tax=Gudongella sp. SC589 TaxID=3385990 RepID=UPI003904DDCF